MNFGLVDDVAEKLVNGLCDNCHAKRFSVDLGCDVCLANFNPESLSCAKRKAYERIKRMLKKVKDAIYKLYYEEETE